jgi:hypothetical protein
VEIKATVPAGITVEHQRSRETTGRGTV